MTANAKSAAAHITPTVPVFHTVLCAVDYSEHSAAALYLAAGLTCGRGARLVVLSVEDNGELDMAQAEEATQRLERFIHRRALPGAASYRDGIDCQVRSGVASDTILDVAAEVKADLIVVGSRGRSGMARTLFGSTASAVLERSTIPVAVVPPSHPEIVSIADNHAAPHFGIVLVPADLKDTAYSQLEFAARLSPGSSHRLLLMTVVPPGDDVSVAMTQLRALAGSVTTARGSRLLVREGTPVERVLSVLEHEKIGIVVLGRSSNRPGKLAYELIARGDAVIVVVPPEPVLHWRDAQTEHHHRQREGEPGRQVGC